MAICYLQTKTSKTGYAFSKFKYISGINKYDYKKNEVVYRKSFMPDNVMPNKFWEAADKYASKWERSCRTYKIALPHELSLEENIKLINKFIEKLLNNKFYYTVTIHCIKSSIEGIYNIHAHIMICEKVIDGIKRSLDIFFKKYCYRNSSNGGARKDPIWSKRKTVFNTRKLWEKILNEELEKRGLEKVSSDKLSVQARKALEEGDFAKAEFLDRKPINIPGYILKKDVNQLKPYEFELLKKFQDNKKNYQIKKQEYYNSLKEKQDKIEDQFKDFESNFNMHERKIKKIEFLFKELNLKQEVENKLKEICNSLITEQKKYRVKLDEIKEKVGENRYNIYFSKRNFERILECKSKINKIDKELYLLDQRYDVTRHEYIDLDINKKVYFNELDERKRILLNGDMFELLDQYYIEKEILKSNLLKEKNLLKYLETEITGTRIKDILINELTNGRFFFIKEKIIDSFFERAGLKEKQEQERMNLKVRKLEEEYESMYGLGEKTSFRNLYKKILVLREEKISSTNLEIERLDKELSNIKWKIKKLSDVMFTGGGYGQEKNIA